MTGDEINELNLPFVALLPDSMLDPDALFPEWFSYWNVATTGNLDLDYISGARFAEIALRFDKRWCESMTQMYYTPYRGELIARVLSAAVNAVSVRGATNIDIGLVERLSSAAFRGSLN